MTTAINGPGSYGAGDYHLGAGFSVAPGEQGAAVTIAGGSLDLMGRTIQGTGAGNTWDFGVRCTDTTIIHDSRGGGAIRGFRVGAHMLGSTSLIRGVDLSFNRYFGAWLSAQGCKVQGGRITDIGGVSDEAYAMGVQINGIGCEVESVQFREMYRQAAAAAGMVGEGLPVNFAAPDAVACLMARCVAINSRAEKNSYGVFAGSGGGGHRVIENTFWNFWRAVAVAQVGAPEVRKNFVYISVPLVGSQGISSPDAGVVEENTVIGYESPLAGRLDDGKNIVLNFPATTASVPPPPPPPPPPSAEGVVLSVVHNASFGNIGTKTLKCVAALSLLSYPSGTPTRIRPTIKAHAGEPTILPKLYIGQPGGTLVQVKQNGGAAIAAGAGEEVALDWVNLAIDKTKGLMWATYDVADPANDRISAHDAMPGAITYLVDGDNAASSGTSGMQSFPNYLSLVTKIETDGF